MDTYVTRGHANFKFEHHFVREDSLSHSHHSRQSFSSLSLIFITSLEPFTSGLQVADCPLKYSVHQLAAFHHSIHKHLPQVAVHSTHSKAGTQAFARDPLEIRGKVAHVLSGLLADFIAARPCYGHHQPRCWKVWSPTF
jgi:hypothetical protein